MMFDCKKLLTEDVTPWSGDVFDHPIYKYTCKLTCREVMPRVHCNGNRCENYETRGNKHEN